MRQDVMARALTDVPIKNQALVNYAYKVLGAESSYTAARQELQKRFGVDLAQIETERPGTSAIKLTKENGKEVQDVLIGRFKGYIAQPQAQAAPAQPSSEIPRALPVEEISNQKLINYAYKVLKVEQRGLVAEKELKTQFGVDLDSLIANRDGVSYVTRKPGPGGNESAVRAVLNASGERAQGETTRHAEGNTSGQRSQTSHTQTVTGKEIARLYERTADALIDQLGGGRAGRTAAAAFLGAQGTSERAIENAIAQKVGPHYIKDGYDPASLNGKYRNSQFDTGAYRIDAMTQELQKLVTDGVRHHHATSHRTEHTKTAERQDSRTHPQQTLEGKEFIARTVIEPGGRFVKHVRDTITDTKGNPVVEVERNRINLGPISFNLPGRQYEIARGLPENQAKELAKQHIRDISRRD